MYLGRVMQGGQIPLTLAVVDASNTPQLPTVPPTARVRSDSGFIQSVTLPILDRYGTTGLFSYPLTLGASYPAGRYRVTYHWTTGSFTGSHEDTFEVVAGGDAAGSVISMTWYERPHGNFVVMQLDPASGQLQFGRNPSL